jgi:CBS domain-containing protein
MAKPRHRVEDFMSTALITLREHDPISRAAQEMTLASIRHLPVVDARSRVVGLLSSHDVVAALGGRVDLEVGKVMARDVRTIPRETLAHEAIATMIDQKIDSLPVLESDGALCGIVTATDFLVVAYQALTGARIERLADEL